MTTVVVSSALASLSLSQLHEWPQNPRKTHDPVKHSELVASVRSQGLLQPLLVRPRPDGGHEVICGNRRRRALVEVSGADDVEVPCLIRALDDDSATAAALKENRDRDDILPLEEAEAFARLSGTIDDRAALVGRSTSYVRQRLRLLRLAPLARALVAAGHLSLVSAVQLAQVEDHTDQMAALDAAGFMLYFIQEAKKNTGRALWAAVAAMTADDVAAVDIRAMLRREGAPGAGAIRAAIAGLSRTISEARFAIVDDTLVPSAGSCVACPNRTGAQTTLFGVVVDADDDTCLDGGCWSRKEAAHGQRLVEDAATSGRLLTADETKGVWLDFGTPLQIRHAAPWKDLHSRAGVLGGVTFARLLNDEEKAQVRVAVDPKGVVRELIAADVARAVEQRADDHDGVDDDVDDSENAGSSSTAEERAAQIEERRKVLAEEQAQKAAAREAHDKTERATVDAIVRHLDTTTDDAYLLRLICFGLREDHHLAAAFLDDDDGADDDTADARLVDIIRSANTATLKEALTRAVVEQQYRQDERQAVITFGLDLGGLGSWEEWTERANKAPRRESKKKAQRLKSKTV